MDWLSQYAWVGALLFARLGAVLMLAPGIGEQTTPTQMRLAAAVLITAALAPSLAGKVPPMPASYAGAIPMIVAEIITGLLMGSGVRILMSALQVAGTVVGISSGLGFAQQLDPIANQPSAVFSVFFSLMGVVLVMAAGLHRATIQAAAESYQVFPPGALPPFGDASMFIIDASANAIKLGIQIAAPVMVFSLIFNIGLGLASRLVPQIQIFMIAMPLSVLLGLAIIALGLGGGLMAWMTEMERQTRFMGL